MISPQVHASELDSLAQTLFVAMATSKEMREALDGGEDPEVLCREHARFAWGAAATFFELRPMTERTATVHRRISA